MIEVKTFREKKYRPVLFLLLLLTGMAYFVRGYHDQKLALDSFDFKTVYGGTRCLLKGCDPYDSGQIYAAFLASGGSGKTVTGIKPMDGPFRPHEAVYSPGALALLTPFALLPWGAAHVLWLLISGGVFVSGALLMYDLCLPSAPLSSLAGIGFLLLTSTTLMMLAQPAQLTIGLCAIAVWCLIKDRFAALGAVCFAITLAFKPHVTGLVWLYFFLSPGRYRRQAMIIFLLTVVISVPGLVWASWMPASSHWNHELPANLSALAAAGRTNDPGPRNLEASTITEWQTIFSLYRDQPSFYNRSAEALGCVLLLVWIVPVLRMKPSLQRDSFAVASVVCISLLPLYHREYDTRMLLLCFPAFALLMSKGWRSRWLTGLLTAASLWLVTHLWMNFLFAHVTPGLVRRQGMLTRMQTILLLRPLPLTITVLALFYLACFYRVMWQEEASRAAASKEPALAGLLSIH